MNSLISSKRLWQTPTSPQTLDIFSSQLYNTICNYTSLLGYSSPHILLGICGWSNSGKTTYIVKLLEALHVLNITCGVIKHHGSAHVLNLNAHEKDEERYKLHGAHHVAVIAPHESRINGKRDKSYSFHEICKIMLNTCDLVLIEGYKNEQHPKIWLAQGNDGVTLPELPPTHSVYEALVSNFSPNQRDRYAQYMQLRSYGTASIYWNLNDVTTCAELCKQLLSMRKYE